MVLCGVMKSLLNLKHGARNILGFSDDVQFSNIVSYNETDCCAFHHYNL